MFTSVLHARILYGSSWHRVCVSCHHHCEPIHSAALLCPGKDLYPYDFPLPLLLYSFSPLFCNDSLVFGGRVGICTSCLGMGNMQLLILCTLCESFCVNHHLLQIEAFLIRVKIYALIKVYKDRSLGISLIICTFSKIIVLGFPLGLMASLIVHSRPQ